MSRTARRTTPGLALAATAVLVSAAVTTLGSGAATAATTPALTITGLTGTGTPGVARGGTATLTDANGAPLAGEDITLRLDRGFFTTGDEENAPGEEAGNLEPEVGGATLTRTTDSNGQVAFQVAIERDAGFDDDGAVTSLVQGTADGASGSGRAAWSSADPLNAGVVDVVNAPTALQEAAINPAVTGDRTLFDVVARDQFGNAVAGEPLEIEVGGTPEFDYSNPADFPSNLDAFGDFWVLSDVPGTLTADVYWVSAPETLVGGSTTRSDEVRGTAGAGYYDVDFARTSMTTTSSAPALVPVGTAVTQTVTVTDQLGRPVRGWEAELFRFGPDAGTGEGRTTQVTNDRGQVSYSFVGAVPGQAKITANVTDGLSSRKLVSEVGFRVPLGAGLAAEDGAKAARKAAKKAAGKGKKAQKASEVDAAVDILKVSGGKAAADVPVLVFRVAKGGALKPVGSRSARLDEAGRATFEVKDTNGKRKTSYVAVLPPTALTFGATSTFARTR